MRVQTMIGGYFLKSEAEKIKEIMTGKTYHHFKVDYSNECGNCTIVVESNEYEENEYDTKEEYQKALEDDFMYYTISELLGYVK